MAPGATRSAHGIEPDAWTEAPGPCAVGFDEVNTSVNSSFETAKRRLYDNGLHHPSRSPECEPLRRVARARSEGLREQHQNRARVESTGADARMKKVRKEYKWYPGPCVRSAHADFSRHRGRRIPGVAPL